MGRYLASRVLGYVAGASVFYAGLVALIVFTRHFGTDLIAVVVGGALAYGVAVGVITLVVVGRERDDYAGFHPDGDRDSDGDLAAVLGLGGLPGPVEPGRDRDGADLLGAAVRRASGPRPPSWVTPA